MTTQISACSGSDDNQNIGWVTITEPGDSETFIANDVTSIDLSGEFFQSPLAEWKTGVRCNCAGLACLFGDPYCEEYSFYYFAVKVTITNQTIDEVVEGRLSETNYWSATIPLVLGPNTIEVFVEDEGNNWGRGQIIIDVKDTIPPLLISKTPEDGATAVITTSPVIATFSEAMEISSINASSFKVSSSSGDVAGVFSISDNNETVTFTPNDNLFYSTIYTVTLSDGVTDLSGLSLDSGVWQFTTGFVDPPSNIRASGGNGEIMISWDAVPYADYYNIYTSTSPDFTISNGTLVKENEISTMITHKGLEESEVYYYIITSVNWAGEGVASSVISAVEGIHWSKQFGSFGRDSGVSVAVDSVGQIYQVGYTRGDLAGTGSAGNLDAFLAKHDATGKQLWMQQFGDWADDYAFDVAVSLNDDSIYITGISYDYTSDYTYYSNGYIAKYNVDGNRIWIKYMDESCRRITVEPNGGVYVTGYASNDNPDGTWQGSETDAFVAKYDSSGNRIWMKEIASNLYDYGRDITVDSSGDAYLMGDLANDIFIAKYDVSGNQLWLKKIDTTSTDIGLGIALSINEDYVYLTGRTYNGSLGGKDSVIAKYDVLGSLDWKQQFGTAADDSSFDIATSADDNVFIIGETFGDLAGTGNAGGSDLFITKYDSLGNQVWVKQFGTDGNDSGYGIAVSSDGNVYITGETFGVLGGDVNLGDNDVFIGRVYMP